MSRSNTEWQDALILLATAVVSAIVVAGLYWARALCVPVAVAIFLTFLLSPVVNTLQRRGVPRWAAVFAVLAMLVLGVTGIAGVVLNQSQRLLSELPRHEDTIRARVRSIRDLLPSRSSALLTLVNDLSEEFLGRPNSSRRTAPGSGVPGETIPQPQVQPSPPEEPNGDFSFFSIASSIFASTAETLAAVALTLVLVLFMLLKREDLRDRLLRAIGNDRVAATTKAMDDAGKRLSRYLLMQFVINATYGLTLASLLTLLHLPYAFLWGTIAGIFRYVPYVGPFIGAAPPILLSLATASGWSQPSAVVASIVVLELVASNLAEPLLYGSSLGVSEVALLISAAFWAFLWGPIGLVLSGPLTVILVVLGQRVPRLRVLGVLLGDEPPLEPHFRYFQRLMARDQDEAADLVLEQIRQSDPVTVVDQVIAPAMNLVVQGVDSEEIQPAEIERIGRATLEIMQDLTDNEPRNDSVTGMATLLLCSSGQSMDDVGIQLLRLVIPPGSWKIHIASSGMLMGESLALAEEERPEIICIGGFGRGGRSHTRYLCKRLRARHPDAKLLVARWGDPGRLDQIKEDFLAIGVDEVAASFAGTREVLQRWHIATTTAASPAPVAAVAE